MLIIHQLKPILNIVPIKSPLNIDSFEWIELTILGQMSVIYWQSSLARRGGGEAGHTGRRDEIYNMGLAWSGEEDNLVTWSLLTNVLAQWSVLLLGSNCSPIEWAGLVVTTILKKNYSMLLLLSGKNYNNIHYVNSNPVFIMEYYKFDIQQL